MENDKCFCHFNGYQVKDAVARNEIESIKNDVNVVSNELATTKASMTSVSSDISKSKTDIEVLKGDISSLKTTTSLNTASISTNAENISNIDNKMGELATLQTTDKSSIVNAVNEIKGLVDGADTTLISEEVNTLKTNVGSLENLNTTDKTSLVNAINEIVNETLNSGWITANLTNDFALFDSNSQAKFIKIGKLVNIVFVVKPTKANNTLNSGTETVVFTLPEEYRPTTNRTILCQGSGTCVFQASVKSTGEVKIGRYREESGYSSTPPDTGVWLPCNLTYIID